MQEGVVQIQKDEGVLPDFRKLPTSFLEDIKSKVEQELRRRNERSPEPQKIDGWQITEMVVSDKDLYTFSVANADGERFTWENCFFGENNRPLTWAVEQIKLIKEKANGANGEE